MARYRIVAEGEQVVGEFVASDDPLRAAEAGGPLHRRHHQQVRAAGGVPGEYRMEQWVAGGWESCGRFWPLHEA